MELRLLTTLREYWDGCDPMARSVEVEVLQMRERPGGAWVDVPRVDDESINRNAVSIRSNGYNVASGPSSA